ncbi:Uncharacterised protein [Vibrio cholerae]|nr:Uncharacterised protein [Vibrio cholerae]
MGARYPRSRNQNPNHHPHYHPNANSQSQLADHLPNRLETRHHHVVW